MNLSSNPNSRSVAVLHNVTGILYYLHDDGLGTPQLATDGSQAVAWKATYQPFATASVSGTITQNLRLPGQYFDVETGWNHNGFRDYAPDFGRYLEPDPLGRLGSGNNLYAYVGNNPVNRVDPLGLCPTNNCTAAQHAAANLANLFDQTSTETGLLALTSGISTVLSGVGEGITFGGDTPVTITFVSLTGFFGTASTVTGLAADTLNTFANGDTTALQNFQWSNLVNLAAKASASKIPGLGRWAETIGNLAEQGFDLTHNAEEACQ